MDDAIEILGEPVPQVDRRAAVDPDRSIVPGRVAKRARQVVHAVVSFAWLCPSHLSPV
jgi:hypothetical protein